MSDDAKEGHAAQWRVPAHRAYRAMHVHVGSAMQGLKQHAFGRVNSASRAGCTRLHH
jgi:hypothetical protein